ncbi:hypothetical protein BRYFOR_05251 [Marvinbryantia formatexigens DSM 14469]|uniref:DUF2316 domain-containing protein n=1 Tax=Marvinbryantia formatexigens DSM 14469 TaxID=478749 RepID=C6L9G1_9FIRM|nr:DUF2316 family protein [Marvinbryantia formatexigens]EET62900.1 hypothetical protein BRYFOR_05251 [Marvinbryantia formatexigens DSM 14469]UWO23496.1 DUF2316 family protein [Marvinbryantia formatexigens DSM 14469]SDG56397.1 hypothetical protein SAMN05660368_02815 [Marvinbryantia formatexigens]
MLTPMQKRNTARELQENYRRLDMDLASVLADLGISEAEFKRVLAMDHPDPAQVWMVRDYLEDKLKEQGTEMYPFSRLADHSANKWFFYETPWRNKQ